MRYETKNSVFERQLALQRECTASAGLARVFPIIIVIILVVSIVVIESVIINLIVIIIWIGEIAPPVKIGHTSLRSFNPPPPNFTLLCYKILCLDANNSTILISTECNQPSGSGGNSQQRCN